MKRLLLLIFVFCSIQSFALTYNTIGAGSLTDPTKWDCNCVPDFTSGNTFIIKHAMTSGNLTISGGSTVNINAAGTIAVTGTLDMGVAGVSDGYLTKTGALTVSGAITLNNGSTMDVNSAFSPSSTITLNGGSQFNANANVSATGGAITLNGTSQFNANSGTVTSNGTLTLNSSSTFNVKNTAVFTRNGAIAVGGTTPGGTLNIASGGTFRTTNSSLSFNNGIAINNSGSLSSVGTLDFNNTTALANNNGATITASGTLTYNSSSTFENNGAITAGSNAINISNGIVNNNSTGSITTTGALTLSNSAALNLIGTLSSGSITLNNTSQVNINAGTVTSNGTLTLNNASTFNVNSGGTFTRTGGLSLAGTGGTFNAMNGSTFTVTGTISSNNNVTINNSTSNSTYTIGSDNGFKFNNSGTGVTLNVNGNPNSAVTITNSSGATLSVPSSIDLKAGSSVTNNGTIDWKSSFLNFKNGTLITNNAGATFNALDSLNSGSMTLNIENYSNMTVKAPGITFQGGTINNYAAGNLKFTKGTFTFNSGTTAHNYGIMSVYDFYNNATVVHLHGRSLFNITHGISTVNNSFDSDGCAVVDVSGTSSNATVEFSGGNNTFTNDADVNLCGKVPYKNQDSDPITAASKTNPIQITVSANNNNRIANGVKVYIIGATGNTVINGYWTVANYNNTTKTFDLVGSDGTTAGTYPGSGATVYPVTYMGSASYIGYSNCTNPCPPLSVDFAYFKALKEDHSVKLKWATTAEENNSVFIIQRSTDGRYFENIGTVNGAQYGNEAESATSYEYRTYIAYDENPGDGINYYRLKQIDLNGKYSYSTISMVAFELKKDWMIYPNPNSGSFTISSSFENEDVQITLVDVTGRIIREIAPSDYSNKIIISDLSQGVYLVNVRTIEGVSSQRVIVK